MAFGGNTGEEKTGDLWYNKYSSINYSRKKNNRLIKVI